MQRQRWCLMIVAGVVLLLLSGHLQETLNDYQRDKTFEKWSE